MLRLLGVISLVFVYGTVMNILFGWGMKEAFLSIPIATLFTVTAIRSTMPGIPEVGTHPSAA